MPSRFLNQVKKLFGPRLQGPEIDGSGDLQEALIHRPIVKSRPLTLEQKYSSLVQNENCEAQFLRLRDYIYRYIDQDFLRNESKTFKIAPRFVREAGKLQGYRSYFFVQPLNQEGLLFERSTHGWVVCRARKVVETGLFLRAYENWDVVTLYESEDGYVRLNSERLGFRLVSFLVYQEKLCESFSKMVQE